jgi:hypothetical protein
MDPRLPPDREVALHEQLEETDRGLVYLTVPVTA